MATLKKNVTKKTLQNKKNVKSSKKKVTKQKVTKKKISPNELKKKEIIQNLKEEVIQEEQIFEVVKGNKIKKVIASCGLVFFILFGAFILGYTLYEPIETVAGDSNFLQCEYSEWTEEEVTFCLVSPEGKYFENDRIIYIYQEETGNCIKKTRQKYCSYK